MEQCNICGKDFELIDLTCLCDKCLEEHSTDIIDEAKRSAMCEANSNAVLADVRAELEDEYFGFIEVKEPIRAEGLKRAIFLIDLKMKKISEHFS